MMKFRRPCLIWSFIEHVACSVEIHALGVHYDKDIRNGSMEREETTLGK